MILTAIELVLVIGTWNTLNTKQTNWDDRPTLIKRLVTVLKWQSISITNEDIQVYSTVLVFFLVLQMLAGHKRNPVL